MEYASIERELFIEAAPEIVFEVISSPEHVAGWWSDEADFTGVVGESGTVTFNGNGPDGAAAHVPLTVVVSDPPRTFTFRWTQDAGVEAVTGNSLLVSFDLVAQGSGTLVRLTETGFREMGWDAAQLADAYVDHVNGWNQIVPQLGEYVGRLVATP
jgi:uncharacterized protein YndB with AHSA1/START domain